MQTLRIIHLEDHPSDATLVERALKRAGLTCAITVLDNLEALQQALQTNEHDIILSDHQLPGFNSFDVLQVLRENEIQIPIILITSTTSEETAVEVMKAGAWDYVRKDQMQRLPQAIKNTLDRHRTLQERKHFEEELRISHRRMIETMDSLLEGCQIINREWRYVYINQTAAGHAKTTPEQLIGRTMMECFPGIDQTPLFAILRHCMERRTTQQMENEFRFPDGTQGWFELRIHPVPEGLFILSVDITQRKTTETEIRQFNERFKAVLRSTNDALFEWDPLHRTVWWSDSFFRMFGFAPSEKVPPKEMWLQRIHPDDRSEIEEVIEHFEDTKDAGPLEIRFMRIDGTYGTGMLRRFVVRNADGIPQKLIGSLIDISYLKAMEVELRLKDVAISSSISGMILADPGGLITYANGAAARMWGFQDGTEMKGHRLLSLFAGKRVESALRKLQISGDTGEETGIRSDGFLFDVAYAANAITDATGASAGIFISFIDISERKESEKVILGIARELANLIQNANAFIVGIDLQGNVTEWNAITEQATGLSRENAIGRHFLTNFIDADARPGLNDQFEQLLQGRAQGTMELPIRTRDGKRVIALTSSTLRRDPEHSITGVLLVGQDMTELSAYRASLEQQVELRTFELNKALQAEKEMVEMRSRFVSMASHEFRTPLSSIQLDAGFVRKYHQKLTSEEVVSKLQRIEKQVEHMTQLLNDVLMAGRIDSGTLHISPAITGTSFFENLAQEIMDSTRSRHRLNFHLESSHQGIVTDQKLLRNIITNLLSNAVKFSPNATEVVLEIRCETDHISIFVKDYGIGIPSGEIRHLFDSFTRGSNVGEIDGTGLGLSITKKAVDLLKGEIHVNSEPGRGTEFRIRIPLNLEYTGDFQVSEPPMISMIDRVITAHTFG
ncbi:MAG: PAS domain S-box protein [Cyclobacteriaceae bacterium]|nr:PAS domain S-box protein [Cyclobacteriaceae bacterium]